MSTDFSAQNGKNGKRSEMPTYPIVAQYELDDPAKRGPLGLLKRREPGEIPKIKPHEVLVWRVGSRYVVDERRLQPADDTVVRASSVSVVSVRPASQVEVSFQIDSEDNSEFTVKVTFICSVLDPVTVVRDGQVNAADALLAYLRGYQDLFDLGLQHPISEINQVRTKMAVQVRAYMTQRPPKISGMEITSATAQVETPVTLGKIKELNNAQQIELERKKGEALLEDEWQTHILNKQAKMRRVGLDPKAALDLAYADGGMTSEEYAQRLQQIYEANEQHRQAMELADTTRRYAVEDRDAQWAHEYKTAEVEWQRTQIESMRAEKHEDRRNQLNANIELLKMLAENGHLDTYNADIEDLIRRIRGDKAESEVRPRDQHAQLPGGQAPESREAEGDNDD